MANQRYFIGLDDTDFGESIGTGALARELQILLHERLGAATFGITRHQFLIHPDIPYTSHNSSACIEIECESSREDVAAICAGLLNYLHHEGADPGLCVAAATPPSAGALEMGRRAQREVVKKADVLEAAAREGVWLRELGGAGIGVIGAFCGCMLRSGGDDGRYVSLRGVRDLKGDLTAGEIISGSEIVRVESEEGRVLAPGEMIHTNDWVRPWLKKGSVVLVVKAGPSGWFIENRKKKEEG
jgi:hypothetical protein